MERTILVDMDGVLADFDAAVEQQLRQQVSDLSSFADREEFYIRDSYPQHQERIAQIHDAEGFFRGLPLVDGALEGWQRLIDLGYQPRICSSPLVSNLRCREEKLEWLEHHFVPRFGKAVVDMAIIDRNKADHNGVALIDDKPLIKGIERATWKHVVFDRSYNHLAASSLRLYGWRDPHLPDLLSSL